MYKTLRGLVLREVKYKESSKILTLLSAEEGKLTVEARGALRKGCKFGASAQQLVFSELTLFENRGRCTLTEGAVLEDFSALRERFDDFALGVYFAELLESVSVEGSADEALLSLGLNSLFALSRELYPAEHIKAVFELRLLSLAGFEPALSGCAVCGRRDPAEPRLSLGGGCVVCGDCPAPEGRCVRLCSASLAAMRHAAGAGSKKIFSFTLDEPSEKRFHTACEEYALYQLDRHFPTLDYWKSLKRLEQRG